MTENQNDGMESGGGQAGAPSQTSSPAEPKPFEGDVSVLLNPLKGYLEERFTNVEKTLLEKLGRVQGTVDRSQNDFQKWMGEVDKLEKTGMSREDAIAKLEANQQDGQWRQGIEKQLSDIASLLQNGGSSGSKQQAVTDVFVKFGLDPKDPRVAPHLIKTFKSPEEIELAAFRLREEFSKSPNPSSAQNASLTGASTVTDFNNIAAEYDELAKNPTEPGAIERMAEIQKELGNLK